MKNRSNLKFKSYGIASIELAESNYQKNLKPSLQNNNIITAIKVVLRYREKPATQKSDSIPKVHIMLPTLLFAVFF